MTFVMHIIFTDRHCFKKDTEISVGFRLPLTSRVEIRRDRENNPGLPIGVLTCSITLVLWLTTTIGSEIGNKGKSPRSTILPCHLRLVVMTTHKRSTIVV